MKSDLGLHWQPNYDICVELTFYDQTGDDSKDQTPN